MMALNETRWLLIDPINAYTKSSSKLTGATRSFMRQLSGRPEETTHLVIADVRIYRRLLQCSTQKCSALQHRFEAFNLLIVFFRNIVKVAKI